MPRNEAQTRLELINPALFARGWTGIIIAIIQQFSVLGTDSIENVVKAGGLQPLNKDGNAKALMTEAKLRLFAA
jgi:hypothetical protein